MNSSAFKKIGDFHRNIDEYRRSLNLESIWIFVATLGCWGVSQQYIRLFALAITFFLFSFQIYHRLSGTKSFSQMQKDAQKEIDRIPDKITRKKYQEELDQILVKRLSTREAVFGSPVFCTCFAFWFVSFAYWAL